MRRLLAVILTWVGLCTPTLADEPDRWVLAIGTHQGGPDQDKLRHAGDDAADFVDVLLAVGGVDGARVSLVRDADAKGIRGALVTVAEQVAAARRAGQRPEFVFYYSGHSDERGLTPWGELVPWAELRGLLASVDAEVRVAVLDSCASGSFVRLKGGTPTDGFPQDRMTLVAGDAVLMSASADESAQESDRLGGSFFTHHLVTGMRGAADTDGDRKVTVQEAYAYASDQTIRSTELSWAGAQHPYYTWDLNGRGGLVLTDLRTLDATLRFESSLDGEISVRDKDGGLVAELFKRNGMAVSYALPTGRYSLRLRSGEHTFKASVNVSGAGPTTLSADDFKIIENLQITRLRGPVKPHFTATHPANVQLVPMLGTYGFRRDIRTVGFAMNILGGMHPEVRGWQVGTWSHISGDLHGWDVEGLLSSVRGQVRGLQVSAANTAGSLHGSQWGVANHVAGDVRGLQWGGVNWAEGTLRGAQIGVINVVRGASAKGQDGAQLGFLYNRAGHGFRGLQLSAVNDAAEISGAQLGVVNVAKRIKGFQLGFLNIADHLDGEALGVINVIKNGYHAVDIFTDDTAWANVSIKTGGKHLYTRLRWGLDGEDGQVLTHVGLGLGVHVQHKRLSFDTDFNVLLPERTFANLFTEPPPGMDLRQDATFGLTISPRFGLFAGPSLGMAINLDGSDPHAPGGRTDPSVVVPSFTAPYQGTGTMRIWPGYQAGLRLTL